MRIISGKFRGTKLETPKGVETRPTSDRARESLFNLLENGQFKKLLRGRAFVDIFAGTGAVGLEALSRGASHGYFIENGAHVLPLLQKNIQKCKCDIISKIYKTSALRLPPAPEKCAIIFIDPPYGKDLINQTIPMILQQGWLADDGVIVTQGHPTDQISVPEGFTVRDERKYGAALLYFLCKESRT